MEKAVVFADLVYKIRAWFLLGTSSIRAGLVVVYLVRNCVRVWFRVGVVVGVIVGMTRSPVVPGFFARKVPAVVEVLVFVFVLVPLVWCMVIIVLLVVVPVPVVVGICCVSGG